MQPFQPREIVAFEFRTIETDAAKGLRKLAEYDAEPHIGARSFLIIAVTCVEPEGLIDVWFIDRFGEPRCLTPETTDLKARRTKAWWDSFLTTSAEPNPERGPARAT